MVKTKLPPMPLYFDIARYSGMYMFADVSKAKVPCTKYVNSNLLLELLEDKRKSYNMSNKDQTYNEIYNQVLQDLRTELETVLTDKEEEDKG